MLDIGVMGHTLGPEASCLIYSCVCVSIVPSNEKVWFSSFNPAGIGSAKIWGE